MIPEFTHRHDSSYIASLNRYKATFGVEIIIVVLYMFAWLFPVISAWVVAISGRRFSFVGIHWQNANIDIVGICLLTALAAGIIAALITLTCLGRMTQQQWPNMFLRNMNNAQRFFLVAVALIAAIGLFKSFGGTVFERSYAGPSIVWLGYGAWGVTYLLCVNLLVGDFLSKRPFKLEMVLVISAFFLPFLLCGSRIEFTSSMLALAGYILVLHDAEIKPRVLMALGVMVWATTIAFLIADVRYASYDPSLENVTIPIVIDEGTLYLSTIGDIGASVFQVVGLTQEQAHWIVGVGPAVLTYATRLLPGPFYPDRPEDMWTQLPEAIGGGALHALGEGYLIFGIGGCAVMGAIFGMLISTSVFAGSSFRSTRTPLSWIFFMFPWLLLIRGGWYQFFALLKTMEVLALLLFILAVIGWLGTRFSVAHSKGHACH